MCDTKECGSSAVKQESADSLAAQGLRVGVGVLKKRLEGYEKRNGNVTANDMMEVQTILQTLLTVYRTLNHF